MTANGDRLAPAADVRRSEGIHWHPLIRVLVALVVAWAVVATAVLGWLVAVPKVPATNDVWESDSYIIYQLEVLFGLTADTIRGYVAYRTDSAAIQTLNASVSAYVVTFLGEKYGPGGFPSGATVNLTSALLYCDFKALVGLRAESFDPSFWTNTQTAGRYNRTADLYQNLSALIANNRNGIGVDPFLDLSPTTLQAIRAQADALHRLNRAYATLVDELSCPAL